MDGCKCGNGYCIKIRPRQIASSRDAYALVQEAVRTGKITLKKVWGEVNPADLFTKHLPSREKVHQLLELFGCEYRSGRAAAAPLLRPNDVACQQGGHLGDDDHDDDSQRPTYNIAEADRPHDASRLPHKHSRKEIAELFPTITAAAAPVNSEDWIPEDERRNLKMYEFGKRKELRK